MATSFTTVITDPEVINELPDLSLLDKYYDENSTVDNFKELVDSSILRQKLQQLLEYKLPDSVKNVLQNNLIDTFISEQDGDAVVTKISDTEVEVDGKVYTVYMHSFGDGIFANDHFNDVFFTTDVLDELFKQNDIYFNNALFQVKKFWDILLANDDLWNSIKENHSDEITRAYKEFEIAYVKIAIKESGQTVFSDFETIEELSKKSSVFSIVLNEDASKEITNNSKFGAIAYAFYATGCRDYVELNEEDVLLKIDNDDSVRAAVTKLDLLEKFNSENEFYKKIVNNDTLLGMVISSYYNLDNYVSFSQLIYSSEYANIVKKMINDKRLLTVLSNSNIVAILGEDFNEVYYTDTAFKNVMYAENKGDKIIGMAVNNKGEAKTLEIVFPDEVSDTFDVPVSTLNFGDNNKPVAAFYNSDSVFGVMNFDKVMKVTDENLFLLFSDFKNKQFFDIKANKKHLSGITFKGEIINSKFSTLEKVNINSYKGMQINNDAVVIDNTDKVIVLGNLNYDPKLIANTISTNLTDIDGVILLDKDVYVVKTDKKIQKVTDSELVDSDVFDSLVIKDEEGNVTESAIDNGVSKAIKLDDYIVVLDKANKLWNMQGDNVVVTSDVKDILFGQDAINVKTTDDDMYALMSFGGALRKFTFKNNI